MASKEIVEKLTAGLVSGKLLPSPLQAKILNTDYRLPMGERDLGVDLIVEFTKDNETIVAAIECKSALSPILVDSVLYAINRKENPRFASSFRDAKLMVAAPHISEPLRSRLKEAEVGYIDLNGNFFLSGRGLYIDIVKPAKEYRNPQGTKNIFLGKSRRLLRVLLCNPYKPYRLENLAAQTGLSVSQVFQVFKRLEDYQVIDRTSAGRQLVKPRKLLNLVSAEMSLDYKKHRTMFYAFYEGKSLQTLNEEISDYCERQNIEFAFTLFPGLEPQQRNLVENVTAVYVARDPSDIASELRIPFVSMGANAILMRAPESDNTLAGGVFYAPRRLQSGLKAVSLVQEYLDFTLYPGRGEEQARFLLNEFLGFRE
jgi:hypothetical protein